MFPKWKAAPSRRELETHGFHGLGFKLVVVRPVVNPQNLLVPIV